MNSLKKIARHLFYKLYNINPYEGELSYECDGRIIRSLSDTKKKVCGTYILSGIENQS